jgi:cytochrome c oxidase subunit IV
MSETDQKTHIFDNPRNVERLLKGFYAICIILVIADFIIHRHTTMDWEKMPAFYAIYGFIACVVLVVVAKMMRKVIMRKENYYNE